jgi:hypothetical protein
MIIALIYGLFFAAGLPEKSADLERVWHVRNESRLTISGESNVNDFRCEVDNYYSADNLHLYSSAGSDFRFSQNRIVIDLMEFDCGRNLITRDFRESLNAERDPEMIINFLSLNRLPANASRAEMLSGNLKITIAGITREVDIRLEASNNGNGTTLLDGRHQFQFSDFNLEPPTKMWGLINVKNELEVSFNLILEEVL